jgi:16S rRNA (adenine1518-N6/adenine1519-N6)-dimethyltransferase
MNKLLSTSKLVNKYNLRAKKSLGQNFIFDKNFTDKIVKSADHKKAGFLADSEILEIGPGPGSLTRSILDSSAKKLIVIEKDQRLLPLLEELKNFYGDKLEVINDDALVIIEEKIFAKPFKIIANLPYNIATPLIIKWLKIIYNQSNLIKSITIMLQKEVAERIVAKQGDKEYGRLAVMINFLCSSKILFTVNKSVFNPPPKVTSAIIELIPHQERLFNANFDALERIVQAAFSQRRKMIRSSLKEILLKNSNDDLNIDQKLQLLNIDPEKRAENLEIAEFCKIAQYFNKNHDSNLSN